MAFGKLFISLLLLSSFVGRYNCDVIAAGHRSISYTSAKLSLDLLAQSGPRDKNAFFSPASILACLNMVKLGANGQTKDQLSRAVFDNLADEQTSSNNKELATELKQLPSQYQVSLANRAYVSKTANILDTYKGKLVENNVSMVSTDFSNGEAARNTMNQWVEEQTKNKIRELLPPDSIDGSTILVLINAIYYKGDWNIPFNESKTIEGDFRVSENKKFKISLMQRLFDKEQFHFHRTNRAIVVGLPFVNDSVSMYFIQPNYEYIGLRQLEENLTYNEMLDMFAKAEKNKLPVLIQIPKFKLTLKMDLKETLKKLNVTDMFSKGKADFSPITGGKTVYVSDAFHKAAIEVNEKGSEAAAATAVIMTTRSGPRTISFNQPFLFAIVHRKTNAILFFGRFADNKFEN